MTRHVLAMTASARAQLDDAGLTPAWCQHQTVEVANTRLTLIHDLRSSPEPPAGDWARIKVDDQAHLHIDDGSNIAFDMVRIAGADSLTVHIANPDGPDLSIFDRQIRALGDHGQAVLRNLHVAVVGLGGTGSAVFEQLVRLGVGTITIVDHQNVEATNVTRIHGSGTGDIGRSKVDVQVAHAQRIGLNTNVIGLHGSVADLKIAEQLRCCDVLFSCTDDHRGRSVMSRISYRYLIPLFNTGVQVNTNDGLITGIHGRVVVAGPGLPCLLCAGQVVPRIAAAEAHSDDARAALAGEGYVPGLGDPAPSIVSYTTAVASLLVAEFLQRIMGLDPAIAHQVIVFDRHKINPQPITPQAGCYCSDPLYVGGGDTDTFLDITWTS